jgi:transcriptional regulator with XRE-family HTH domain
VTAPAFRGRTLGERVAELRRRAGMSQKDLATAVSRSESWVSQVERDVLPVERLSVLHSLADALGASMRDLRPETAAPSSVHDADAPAGLDRLRQAVTGPAALAAGLGTAPAAPRELDELRTDMDKARQLARSADLDAMLAPLITDLELAVREARGRRRAQVAAVLVSAYQVAAAAFARQNAADAAWLAADRATRWADETGDRFAPVAAGLRMGQAFLAMELLDRAEYVATAAVTTLKPLIDAKDCPAELLSLYGGMQLLLADGHARKGDRAATRASIAAARTIAALIGADRNDYDTEFGPTDVELHAVSTAVELGDAGEAIELAATIDAGRLSAERQSRLLIDLARAHVQRRRVDEAIAALKDAERLAPEQLRTNPVARAAVQDLLSLVGTRRATADLQDLAHKVGAVR